MTDRQKAVKQDKTCKRFARTIGMGAVSKIIAAMDAGDLRAAVGILAGSLDRLAVDDGGDAGRPKCGGKQSA